MTDRWGKLRDRFKTKNIDLDAEFEKFLNEVRSSYSNIKAGFVFVTNLFYSQNKLTVFMPKRIHFAAIFWYVALVFLYIRLI